STTHTYHPSGRLATGSRFLSRNCNGLPDDNPAYCSSALTGSPSLNGTVRRMLEATIFLGSMPTADNTVAWMLATGTSSTGFSVPSGSVAPITRPGQMPPPAMARLKPVGQ